jgi:hypothetical protein
MKNNKYKKEWEEWRDKELTVISPLLNKLGFILSEKQVHIKGERYISSGQKLILIGKRKIDNKKIVIKISKNKKEINEIKKERKARETLKKINFAYHTFLSPQEILFIKKNKYYIFITEFIEQEKTFLERDLKEQFFLSLKAFEVQEGAHATTYNHSSLIYKNLESINAQDYINKFLTYKKNITLNFPKDAHLQDLLDKSLSFLIKHKKIINLYSNFLTHWDFVPHNIRIKSGKIYLLDHSSLRFGNKHEGQARFINFMILYNRALEKLLINYIRQNRSSEESLSLLLMRIFRLGEIMSVYADTILRADENLKQLNLERFKFWSILLEKLLKSEEMPDQIIENYKKIRDSLRSEEEKERQKKLH